MRLGNDFGCHAHDSVVPGPRRQNHPQTADLRRIRSRHRPACGTLQHHNEVSVSQLLLQCSQPDQQPPSRTHTVPPPPIRPRPDHVRSINNDHATPPTIHHPSLHALTPNAPPSPPQPTPRIPCSSRPAQLYRFASPGTVAATRRPECQAAGMPSCRAASLPDCRAHAGPDVN
jgi:hypothetical protein